MNYIGSIYSGDSLVAANVRVTLNTVQRQGGPAEITGYAVIPQVSNLTSLPNLTLRLNDGKSCPIISAEGGRGYGRAMPNGAFIFRVNGPFTQSR